MILCFMVTIFNKCKIILFVHGDCLFDSLTFFFIIPKLHFNSKLNAWPILHNPFNKPINPKIQKLIYIHFNFFLLYEDHGIIFLQTYIQKMCISANSRGLWGDNHAIFCLANYSHRPIHVWSKTIMRYFLNGWCFHKQ